MKKLLSLYMLTLVAISLSAGTISGVVKDVKTNNILEFANVAVHMQDNEEIITGSMSDVDGSFRIIDVPVGEYYIVLTYIGYERKTINNIAITSSNQSLNLGTVMLKPTALQLGNVVVSAEKPAVSYKIDKRVIDAQQFLSAQGGTAIDILENVPSVDVDIEGNVSLRGSSNFTVMIDGRPSVLEPQDALESIPASSIENIEIMTNASAKYEAEGGAGIINIVTRRDKRIGVNGLATANVGTNNLGGNLLLNYTNKKINAFVSVDFSRRNFTGESYVERVLTFQDSVAEYISTGDRERSRGGLGVRGGFDWFITKNDVVGISGYFGKRGSTGGSTTEYEIINRNLAGNIIYNTYEYTSYENSTRGGIRISINADYTHKFNKETEEKKPKKDKSINDLMNSSNGTHQLKFSASYSNWDMDEESWTYLVNDLQDTIQGQRTEEIGPSNGIKTKIEYTLPWGENNVFEAGYSGRFNWKEDANNVYYLNTASGDFELQDAFSYFTEYKQNTLSLYALYSGEFGLLGIQPGLRAEYTYRNINSNAQDSAFVVDRLHIFPTLHASYQLPEDIQLMASYTRRISRPRGWQLEPFYTWYDTYNIRVGNPELVPEMTDSYDFSVQKRFGKSFVSLDAYYKNTQNKIERIQTVYSEDVILNTYENVGRDQSLGVEVMANLNIYKWWMMNFSGRLYRYQVEGTLYGESFDESSTNYSMRLRNTFMIKENTRIQVGLNYRSPSATAQGSSSGGLMTDFAVRQDFFKDKLTATLQVRDIFGTGFRQYEIITPDYTTYSEFYRDAPMISLNLSFKINNYKNKKKTENKFDDDGFNSEENGDF